MARIPSGRAGRALVWGGVACAILLPLVVAAASPLQAFRDAPYIVASLSGIAALAVLFLQPLLAAGYLPGLTPPLERRLHRWLGTSLVVAVALHVGGLYLTSPPDALDALLLVSPTPFSVYGVTAMWAIVLTALLVILRRRLPLAPGTWRIVHNALAVVVVVGTVVHALMIEGTMGAVSKWTLCLAALGTTAVAVVHLRVVRPWRRRTARS